MLVTVNAFRSSFAPAYPSLHKICRAAIMLDHRQEKNFSEGFGNGSNDKFSFCLIIRGMLSRQHLPPISSSRLILWSWHHHRHYSVKHKSASIIRQTCGHEDDENQSNYLQVQWTKRCCDSNRSSITAAARLTARTHSAWNNIAENILVSECKDKDDGSSRANVCQPISVCHTNLINHDPGIAFGEDFSTQSFGRW